MSATNSGGGKANQRGKDQARAAFMKDPKRRGQYKDSITRGFTGHGLEPGVRAMLRQMMGGTKLGA